MMRPGTRCRISMQINPPFGYSEIVLFARIRKWVCPPLARFRNSAAELNAVPISYSEFGVACRDTRSRSSTTDRAGLSFRSEFWGSQAARICSSRRSMDGSVYLRRILRRYPFCMARVTLDSVEQADRLI